MTGRLSELTNNTDVDDDLDEFEHRDVSETADNDAQNKAWTLGVLKGILPFKQPVRAATTASGTLASDFENGDTIDGVSLSTGDRILIKDQSSGDENGIYIVAASGAPSRAPDFDTSAKVKGGMVVPVQEGTANGGKAFRITNTGAITIDTTSITFSEFGAGGGGGDFTDLIPCTMEVPEGTVAYPDIHSMTGTINKKISGFVLPDGASVGIINFKCVVPDDLASTPAMKIRVRFITLDADSDHAVRLTVRTVGIALNEDMDIGMTSETEVTAECPNADDTMNEATIEIDLTTDWVAGDTVLGKLERDPTDAVDDYAGDILIVGIDLVVERTAS